MTIRKNIRRGKDLNCVTKNEFIKSYLRLYKDKTMWSKNGRQQMTHRIVGDGVTEEGETESEMNEGNPV